MCEIFETKNFVFVETMFFVFYKSKKSYNTQKECFYETIFYNFCIILLRSVLSRYRFTSLDLLLTLPMGVKGGCPDKNVGVETLKFVCIYIFGSPD